MERKEYGFIAKSLSAIIDQHADLRRWAFRTHRPELPGSQVVTFGLKESYLIGFNAFVFLGLLPNRRPGHRCQCTDYRDVGILEILELVSGVILLVLILPPYVHTYEAV